ncbi:MAG: histidine phosphatase family protein [Gammaproteobacteria bacterium]|nr:histidine phosphatase family protein [Gammaproteobacteria bacterium]MDH3372246.1 histidine phosphatase family protein [Gammaproteobacteria bacterium]MDH3409716.1 histidine phosphatase family protein [Gammaproteobacteria bacterium]
MRSTNELDRRRRRRQRRIQVVVVYTAIAICLAWFFESQATTTIIFVRHAEKADSPASDPGLSEAGEGRVAELTRQLVEADVVAGVDAVYATAFQRAQETARPIADALDLPVNTYDAADTETVLETILKAHKGKIILVVGHSNTVPVLIANLGASKNVPPIAEDEYDNIYIISIPWFGKTKTIRLRFGEPYVAGQLP